MADDFVPGLEGVIAFETEIAEPDKDGGALRYRGVDIEDLVGKVTFGNVWALLVDGKFGPGLPPAEPFPIPVHTGDVRVDVQAALAMLTPIWGYRPLLDIDAEEAREELARAAVMALSYVAQSARGIGIPAVPQKRIDEAATIVERFMVRWRGEPDPAPRRRRRRLLDVGRRARHERLHLHRPRDRLHRRRRRRLALRRDRRDVRPAARRRALPGAAHARRRRGEPATPRSTSRTCSTASERLMGFGHRVYRAEDPRARVLRRPPRSSAPRASRPRWRWRRPRSRSCASGVPTGRSRPTWSSGRRSSWTSPRCPATCSPRCSPAPAPPAGARTSSSRRTPAGWCARRRATSAPTRASPRRSRAGTRSDQGDHAGPHPPEVDGPAAAAPGPSDLQRPPERHFPG